MKSVWSLTALGALAVALAAAPAHAQTCKIGGHNETSENFATGGWATVNMSPGSVTGSPVATHLVISEVAPRGAGTGTASDSSEYVEIYNPTNREESLDHVYLGDDGLYYQIVNGPYNVTNNTDWVVRFPPGLSLSPGRTALVCVTKQGFFGSGATPGTAQYFLEMKDTNGDASDDMIVMTPNSSFLATGGSLTNPSSSNGEWVVLFCWNGASDLVCDLDYASWGANSASNPKLDKTGVSIDGPDADAIPSTYNADSPAASQTNLGSGTTLTKPNTYQRVGGEIGEVTTGGNGCTEPNGPVPSQIDWGLVPGTTDVRFHVHWTNPSPTMPTDPVSSEVRAQEFGVFLPDLGVIGSFDVPPLAPDSFFDVFFEVPLSSLPPSQKQLPGGGPDANDPCPPDTNWSGNIDVVWTGSGIAGTVNKHYGQILVDPGNAPSYIHIKDLLCPNPVGWTVGALCPGFSATLVNEDLTPAPNPVPPGWTGWISISAAAGTPPGTTCCFTLSFDCDGVPAEIEMCVTTCGWIQKPTLTVVDWRRFDTFVRFHQRWENPDPQFPSDPVSGDMMSQPFGVFVPDFGPIGHFDIPPLVPDSFFDVFFDVAIADLPPEPAQDLPGGGPGPGTPCPTDTSFHCNVDINWDGPGGSGQVNKHYGDLFVCPGATPSYLHTITFCNSATGAQWTINGVCPGFTVTLVNEDKSPAPNPVPPGWTGWICVSAPATTPAGQSCCFDVTFVCDGVPGVIDVCAITCNWAQPKPTLSVVEWSDIPGEMERFHLRFENPSAAGPTQPGSGHIASQPFGVFAPDFGAIGVFDIPPIPPESFFDVFFDVPKSALPPEPEQHFPGGGPPAGTPCPPDTIWNGNVDVQWNDPTGGGQVNRHYAELLVRPGVTPSYLHVLTFCNAAPAQWSFSGLCAGFTATLLNQDFSPAPNPVPPGWFGWIAITAAPGTPAGTTCCFSLTFVCAGTPGVIDLCVTTCEWEPTGVPLPAPATDFGIYAATPNPTTGATVIALVVPRSGEARVEVYDVGGKRVRVLLNGTIEAGPRMVRWDGRGENDRTLPPGTYLVTLRSDGRFASRKVVLVH